MKHLTFGSFIKSQWYPIILVKPDEGKVIYVPTRKGGKMEPYMLFTARIDTDKPRYIKHYKITFPYWKFARAIKRYIPSHVFNAMQGRELYVEISKTYYGKIQMRNARVI